ncbi:hypothetical protein FBUS_08436 [Fasciolopsis buskii]|uniref:Uncharacterized protein n=1 Tax=Fasciolopsis buskii TaxID=27845 RepID=A0A8E0RSX6_9TREM|nr:hypothetical protein FBUS_08436 [Fasciolopsis buski]
MTRHSHSSVGRSEDTACYTGGPIFHPGWWKQLKTSQKWAFVTFIMFYTLGLFLFCSSITSDIYFEHRLQLIGLRRKDVPDQAVSYNLTTRSGVGFWSNVDYQDDHTVYSEQEKVNALLHLHARIASELWMFCTARAHRAKACGSTAFMLLTVGLIGLFTGYVLMIFDRKLMIITTVGCTTIIQASFALIYAASIEYNNCIIDRQVQYINDNERRYTSYKGRYFAPAMVLEYRPLMGVLISYIFAFIPMDAIGVTLLVKNAKNL